MRVGIYARVSDERDQSVPWQLATCREYADAHGWEVVDEYVEDPTSAFDRRKRRPEYERLVADLEAGRIDAPLTTDLERLLRQDKEGQRWLDLREVGRVRFLCFAEDTDIDLDRANPRRDFKKRVADAVGYSERLSEKIKRTMRGKAAAGEWNGGGRRPFGYRVAEDPTRRRPNGEPYFRLVPDPREAEAIRDAARRVLSGGSLYAVARDWNDGPDPLRKDSGSRWTLTDVRRVLLSEQVAGFRGGVEGTWEAILDRDTHEALKARLRDPSRRIAETVDRQAARAWPLAGILRCGECGTRLDGIAQQRKRPDGSVRLRRAYTCHSCGRVGVTAPGLERYVLEAALRLPEPEPDGDPTPAPPSEREAALLAEIRDLEERKDRIGDALADGLDPRQAVRATAQLNERLEATRRELGRYVRGPIRGRRTYLATIDEADAFLEGEADELPRDWALDANAWLREVVNRVEVARARSRGVRSVEDRVAVVWK